jgi:hypothetical protein
MKLLSTNNNIDHLAKKWRIKINQSNPTQPNLSDSADGQKKKMK